MTAKQLTDSILQMAIQGKLVPQDPNDEPASALLERIRSKKERMVKEKLLKKNILAETEINTEDIPFDIPDSWVWTTISNIFTINPKVNGEDNDKAAFIPMDKIDSGYSSSFKYEVKKWKEIKSSYINFADGDVAFAKITPCFQNRKSVIFCNLPNGIGAGTTELKVLRQYGETIDRKYLLYFLKSPYFINEAKFKGTANQQRIVIGYLENKYFPLPPLAEQHRIVERIEEYLSVIREYGEAYDEASKMDAELPGKLKKSILQEAIMGKLGTQDPSDEPASVLLEEIRAEKKKLVKEGVLKKKDLVEIPVNEDEMPFKIPKGWEWVRAKDCCSMIFSGKSPSYSKIPTKNLIIGQQANQWNGIDMKYVKYGTDNYVKNIADYQYLIDGDVLLNTLGNGTLGRCGIFENIKEKVLTDGHLFVFRCLDRVTSKYFLYYLTLNYTAINEGADGSTNQTFLNLKKVSNYIIPLPPLAEQHRIVQKIEELYAEIDNMTASNNIIIKGTEETDNE